MATPHPPSHEHDHEHGHEHHEHPHTTAPAPKAARRHAHEAHGHTHAPASYGRAFAIGIGLNLAFVVIEVVYGVLSHSVALLADAGHNFGDVLGLGLSWGATALASLKPSTRRTFGYRRSTIIASVANAFVLLFVTGGLTWESIQRLLAPAPTQGKTMICVALVGATINTASALLFMNRGGEKGHAHGDLNVRSAFLHLAYDALLAVGVAITGALILFTGWLWLDPAVSIVLAVTILVGTWSLMKQSLDLMLDAVPEGIDPDQVKAFLGALPGVVEVHDLHIWAMSTTETALTAHIVMPGVSRPPSFLNDVCKDLNARFEIQHSTLQIDPDDAPHPCALAPDEVV